jgi:hypothetical protein
MIRAFGGVPCFRGDHDRLSCLCCFTNGRVSNSAFMNRVGLILASDVAMQYSFARCDHRVEAKDFDPSFHDAWIVGSTMGHFTKQYTWILPLMQSLPDLVTIQLNADMASYIKPQRVGFLLLSFIPKASACLFAL